MDNGQTAFLMEGKGGGLPTPPPGPKPLPVAPIRNSQFGRKQHPENLFWPAVKGSENWFDQICLYPKCCHLNGELKSFISPHHCGLGLCSQHGFCDGAGCL